MMLKIDKYNYRAYQIIELNLHPSPSLYCVRCFSGSLFLLLSCCKLGLSV